MNLDTILVQACMEVDLELSTLDQYQRALKKYSEHLGREATKDDLQVALVNRFLAELKAKGKTGVTIQNYKSAITKVWNYAVERELVPPYDPRRLRRSNLVRKPVRAWSVSQVKILTDAAIRLPGNLQCGLPRAAFAAALVRVMYDTGLRPADLRLLRWSDVDLSGLCVSIVQNKTHRQHTAPLSPIARDLLVRIRTPRERVFPLTKDGMRYQADRLFKLAESLGFARIKGQGLGTLRKTHATQIYQRDGEHAAAESLGHVGGTRTVRAHYIDARAIKAGRLPPDPAA